MRTLLASTSFSFLLALAACGGGAKTSPTPEPGPAPEPDPAAATECVRSGCSATMCVPPGKEMMTTCEYKPEYACYDQARCEPQPSGECGWTPTPELDACLKSGGPANAD